MIIYTFLIYLLVSRNSDFIITLFLSEFGLRNVAPYQIKGFLGFEFLGLIQKIH